MAEYTTTREGFQRAMERSLTGRPEDSKLYAESTATPAFYQVMKNGRRIPYDGYVKGASPSGAARLVIASLSCELPSRVSVALFTSLFTSPTVGRYLRHLPACKRKK